MATALPPNLQAEVALDRGRLSGESTSSRSPSIRRVAVNPHERVQSLHGHVEYMSSASPRFMPQQGAIIEEESGATLSAAELAAQLDEGWDDGDDVAEQSGVMYDGKWYDDVGSFLISIFVAIDAHATTFIEEPQELRV